VSTGTAVTREAAYLQIPGTDGLPALLSANGGPWNIVQAYWTPSRGTRVTRLYLVRGSLRETRFAAHRKIDSYNFVAKLYWPVGATTTGDGMWEAEQLAFEAAIDLLLQRIRQTDMDHTHGSFLSVAEAPQGSGIEVHQTDPEVSANSKPSELTATVTYSADDRDFTG
jgi:hypothetical protein